MTKEKSGSDDNANASGSVSPMDIFKSAMARRDNGDLQGAEADLRRVLEILPDHAPSLGVLALVLTEGGNAVEAEALAGRAIEINPSEAMFHYALGYARAVKLNIDPEKSELPDNDPAMESYRKALALQPNFADCLFKMACRLLAFKHNDEALEHFKKVVNLKPDHAEAYYAMGMIYYPKKMYQEALACHKKSIAIKPNAHAHNEIGLILHDLNRYFEAASHFYAALEIWPKWEVALLNLAILYYKMDEYEKAKELYEQCLELQPNNATILTNIGALLKNMGALEDAVKYHRRALAQDPTSALIYSNILLTMLYMDSVTPEAMAEESRIFGRTIADPVLRTRPMIRDRTPGRRLRVGFVSPDFYNHPVRYFLAPLIAHLDRSRFEVFAYSNVRVEDAITARFKTICDQWRNIQNLSADQAADLIESDAIDILIDPSGHTADNCLMILARKPAPVQVTWLGFPATSGIKAIDYRISDFYAEPPGMTEHLNVETLWRLPRFFCCYEPHEKSPAVIDHPPFEDNGYVTFGCFNNFTKVTDPVLTLWAEILKRVPDSRLLLEIGGIDREKYRNDTIERLKRLGLPMDRVILELRTRANQFVLYNRLDIALDPFPCCGGTTSMDALWMGVPLVTLAGKHFSSRLGVTVLSNGGMPELIAEDEESYIRIAAALAQDRPRLKALRHNLRDRIAASPLMDQAGFARDMEDALEGMWKKWLETP
jgi:protein O-GlcNAc transferase